MTYVLVIMLGLHPISAPFPSKAACEEAMAVVMQDSFFANLPTKPVCEPKGKQA